MAMRTMPPTTHGELLELLDAQTLQRLARVLARLLPTAIDFHAIPTRKGDCIQTILDALAPEANLAKAFAALSSNERQTIGAIVHAPGLELDSVRYEAIHQTAPVMPRHDSTPRVLHALLSSDAVISPDLAMRLRPLAPPPQEPVATYLPAEPPVGGEVWVHASEQAACHDIMAVLSMIEQKSIKVSATTGHLTEAGAAPLRAVLLAGDYYTPEQAPEYDDDVPIGKRGIKPFAWTLLVQAAGLASVSGGKLVLTKAGMKARTQPAHEVLRTVWQRWLKYKDFHEFSRLEEIKGQKSSKRPLTAPNEARKAMDNTLAQLEVNRWISLDAFFTFMCAIGENFSVVRDPWVLYRSDTEYGSFGYNHLTWEHLDGRFAMAFLLEYCATMGLIDVGISLPWGDIHHDMRGLWGWDDVSCISRYDGLQYLRLTPLGAWILGAAERYVSQRVSVPACKVLPNGDVVLTRPVEPAVHLQLERIAEKTADNVYQISKEKILSACEEGVALQQLQDFLCEQIDHELPGTIRALFQEIEANLRKFTFDSAGYLIRCTDPWLITLVMHEPALKGKCLAVGEDYLYLRKGQEKAFRGTLKKLGYVLPQLPTGEG